MHQGGRRDQGIGLVAAVGDVEMGTARRYRVVDGKDAPGEGRPDMVVQPGAEEAPLGGIAALDAENTALELEDGYGGDEEARRVTGLDPGGDGGVGLAVADLAQLGDDMGVEEVVQSRSTLRVLIAARGGSKSMSERPGMASAAPRLRCEPLRRR